MLQPSRRLRSHRPFWQVLLLTEPVLLGAGLLLAGLPAQTVAHSATIAPASVLPSLPTRTQSQDFTAIYMLALDTLGFEHVTVSDTAWIGDLRMKGQPRMQWVQSIGEPAGTRTLRFTAWRPNASATDAPMQQLTLQTRGDSAYVFAGTGGGTPQATLPVHAGTMWLVNPSVVHGAWIAQTIAPSDTAWLLPAIGPQLAAPVTRGRDTTSMSVAGVAMRFGFDATGALQWAAIPAQRLSVHVVRGTAAEAVNRQFAAESAGTAADGAAIAPSAPSYAAPADAPYTAEEVRIPTPNGHTLAGTFTRPRSAGARAPVVVTITGSGPQERDEAIPGVEGYRLFAQIADTLGRRGIGVLRLDDRGIGESGGTFRGATSQDFAADIRAAVAWLRSRDDVDPARIGLVGHSEGGLIAPMLAAEDPTLAAIVLMAGPAYTGRRVITSQQRSAIDEQYPTSSVAERSEVLRVSQVGLDSIASTDPWLGAFLAYDPVPTARRVTQMPVLILQGNTDQQVTPEQADTLAAAFRVGGNGDVTVHRLRDTNHLFQRDPSGLASGYGVLPDRRVTTEALGLLADWLSRTLTAR